VQAVALWFACFTVALIWYYPFLADDVLIAARYAVRLADGAGLSWNDGY
jgi:hypothetical protein